MELAEIAGKEKEEEEGTFEKTSSVIDRDAKKEWWKDGEYDEKKADEANDLGSKMFENGKGKEKWY